ncbi:CAF17-like 4Fe-4S cluster assembly/insertion protein YgfZ [Entomobacter blattae]|uniref:tRNA-modifying protein YgfZ n=1 Tax=Entomobacter blattae TaxID=2762277 RepID=A0A7H1NSR4_9PROT|nr:folate-binding protein YgfZ [Entomobacter blattae]QNT78824.1 tRNA-modifying protein YgfZ [Entomobacter blattae]
MYYQAHLTDRRVIEVSGSDRTAFLQGLVSNNVEKATAHTAVWAALLTAQGKWKADFFITSTDSSLYLDCEETQADMIFTTLTRYKLKADVKLKSTSLQVFAFWSHDQTPLFPLNQSSPPFSTAEALITPDPRCQQAGYRCLIASQSIAALDKGLITSQDTISLTSLATYHAHRITLGLPDPKDCILCTPILLEANFDIFNGIDWKKGCYLGQEVTARSHYRGLVKKRIMRIEAEEPLPMPGSSITESEKEVGILCTTSHTKGLALLRLDHRHKNLTINQIALKVNPIPQQFDGKPFS